MNRFRSERGLYDVIETLSKCIPSSVKEFGKFMGKTGAGVVSSVVYHDRVQGVGKGFAEATMELSNILLAMFGEIQTKLNNFTDKYPDPILSGQDGEAETADEEVPKPAAPHSAPVQDLVDPSVQPRASVDNDDSDLPPEVVDWSFYGDTGTQVSDMPVDDDFFIPEDDIPDECFGQCDFDQDELSPGDDLDELWEQNDF